MKKNLDPAPESHSVNETEQNINAQETTNSNNEVMKEKNAVKVSTPNDIPTALDANEQATTAGSPVDEITNQASVIPIGLDSRRIYTWDELSSQGFKKAGLRNNREVNDKVVKNILVLQNTFEKTRKQMKVNTLSINALSDNLNFPMFAKLILKKT